MAEYGDLDTIKVMLDIDSGDTSLDERLTQLNVVASQELSDACGHDVAWGEAVADVAITYTPDGLWSKLVLSKPIRSVTTIEIDGDLVDEEDYSLIFPEGNGLYWGIASEAITWYGEVVITGQWGGMPTGDVDDPVPPDVVEAVNILVAGYFRRDQTSEGQVTGPERFTFIPTNPWLDQRVVRTVSRYDTEAEILF